MRRLVRFNAQFCITKHLELRRRVVLLKTVRMIVDANVRTLGGTHQPRLQRVLRLLDGREREFVPAVTVFRIASLSVR